MDKKRLVLLVAGTAAAAGLAALLAVFVVARLRGDPAGRAPLNTATVIQRIQHLAEMVTVKYVMEKVVVLEDPKYLGGLIPLGQNRIILLAHGTVKAGVDLSRLQAGDLSISGRKAVLVLPKASVTDAYLVEQRTRVLDHSTGVFLPFDKTLEQTARRYALAEITRAARQNGIEDEATEQARQQLTRFLQALGFAEVEVRIRSK
jgi:hypothetical protein